VRRSRRSEDNIKIDLKNRVRGYGLDLSEPVTSSCERGNEYFDSMKQYNFMEWLLQTHESLSLVRTAFHPTINSNYRLPHVISEH
jgi:uncharacterized protein with NAD-binding domain and iron-sulfur cluster